MTSRMHPSDRGGSAASADAPADPAPGAASPATRRGWRWWLSTGLVGAAAVWLAFTVAHLALSGTWWGWLAVDVLPPPAFLAVPVALALLAAGCRRAARRPVALLAAAALLLGAERSGISVRALAGGDGPAPPDAIRIFSWNTAYWDEGGQTEALHRVLRAADADVYLLQEYWYAETPGPDQTALDRLRAEFPGYQLAVVGELVTLSRFPILRRLPLEAPDMPPPTAGSAEHWRYKVLRTDLDLGAGRALSTYNVHLPVPLSTDVSPFDADFYRIIRAQHAQREPQWRALARDVPANGHPLVVAGDLNTSPAMGDLGKLPAGLRDAAVASRSPYPATWSDAPGWPRWWRLDWAFVSASVRVHEYRLSGPTGVSDHRAQELVVSLR